MVITKEESALLLKFIADKSKNIIHPLNRLELCKQFQKETGSSVPLSRLHARIRMLQHKIHAMESFNMDTTVRMIYAIGAPVDPGFLNDLRKVADVEVDDQQRIVRYKEKGEGGLELDGTDADGNEAFLDLIAEESQDVKVPSITGVCKKIKQRTDSPLGLKVLAKRVTQLRDRIRQTDRFDRDTKVRMMYATMAPVDAEFLNELSEVADVEIDDHHRLIKYKERGEGGLELDAFEANPALPAGTQHKLYQNDELVEFIARESDNVKIPNVSELCRKFMQEADTPLTLRPLMARVHRLRHRIHEMHEYDMDTKVRMIYATYAPVNKEFLKEMKKFAHVEVDDNQHIIRYEPREGGLELSPEEDETLNEYDGRLKLESGEGSSSNGQGQEYEEEIEETHYIDYEECDSTLHSRKRQYSESIDEVPKRRRISEGSSTFFINDLEEKEEGEEESVNEHPNFLIEEEEPVITSANLNPEVTSAVQESNKSNTSSINLLEFLDQLRISQIPIFSDKIDREIRRLTESDKEVPIEVICDSLISFLEILTTPDEMACDEETTALSSVIHKLGTSLCYMIHPLMDQFQKELRRLTSEGDMDIPLDNILLATETFLEKLMNL